ncbi:MAG: hypothetical protein KGS61_01170 [Verrucomicrobia bacterium]|nr:hypothetical protein [Verrucomicrobiota bacterium]
MDNRGGNTLDHTDPASLYSVKALRKDVQADRDLLARMNQRAAHVKPDQDPKLAVLVEELVRIVKHAKDEASMADDERQKRKVLVFSFYEDTVDWIEAFLDCVLERDKRLACYRGHMASVVGNEVRHGVSRRDAIWGFAPQSSGALAHALHCLQRDIRSR